MLNWLFRIEVLATKNDRIILDFRSTKIDWVSHCNSHGTQQENVEFRLFDRKKPNQVYRFDSCWALGRDPQITNDNLVFLTCLPKLDMN